MSSFSFRSRDFFPNPNSCPDSNPNPNHNVSYNHLVMDYPLPSPDFNLSDYLVPEAGSEEDSSATKIGFGCELDHLQLENAGYDLIGDRGNASSSTSDTKCKGGVKRIKMDVGIRIAFKTKSDLEIMDDGFKWRKYGKKAVKNSPYPRNYYRCASEGCYVKKRVERDSEDSSYVITSYDGIHNHESPCVVYYNQVPLMVPSGWTLQASNSSS